MKLVLVEWVDSHSDDEWKRLRDIKKTSTPTAVRSVGWLIHDGKDGKTILPHVTGEGEDDDQGFGYVFIPAKVIVKTKVLTA